MAESKKNTCSLVFCTDALYIKFQVLSSSGSLVLQPTKSVTDRRTNGQTDRWTDGQAKPICPLNIFEVGGIKISYSTTK